VPKYAVIIVYHHRYSTTHNDANGSFISTLNLSWSTARVLDDV